MVGSHQWRTGKANGARLALGLLLLINLFNYIDRQVLAAVLPWLGAEPGFFPAHSRVIEFMHGFQQTFGFEPKMALLGLLTTAFMVLYMVSAPVFARLAEHQRAWRLVAVGVLFWSLASGASGWAMTFGVLLLTRCFVGVGEGAYGPIAPTMLSDYFPIELRGKVLAWFYAAIPVGSALGYVLGGVLGHSFLGWRWAFYLAAVPGILLALACWWMQEPPRASSGSSLKKPRSVPWRDYLTLLRTPSYVLCTLGMIAMTFALGGLAVWMPFYLEKLTARPGLTGDPTALFGGLMAVSGLLGTLCGGWAGDKLRDWFPGAYFAVSAFAMLTSFPLFLAFFYVPFPWAWGVLFAVSFCVFFNTGPTNTILANVTSPSIRAAGFALNILVIHALGDALSPFVIGLLSDRYSLRTAFLIMSLTLLVSGVFWLCGTKWLARDTERVEEGLGLQTQA